MVSIGFFGVIFCSYYLYFLCICDGRRCRRYESRRVGWFGRSRGLVFGLLVYLISIIEFCWVLGLGLGVLRCSCEEDISFGVAGNVDFGRGCFE